VPVPSQDKLGGLQQEGHDGDDGGGSLISLDEWRPVALLLCLPLISPLAP